MRAQSDPAPPMPVGFYPTYAFNGTMIDGAGQYHHVQMELVCLLDSTLVGSYHTWHENDGLSLTGRLKSDSSFTLNERDEHGRFTGVFRGRVQGAFERLLGTWTSVGNWDRTMSVDLGRRHEAYAEYLSKWRSYPEYRDLDEALNATHVVRQLNLSRHGMIGVDDLEGVDRLQDLLSLDLLANGFDTLPRVVCALTNLEDLSLSSNDHIHIPPCIAQLKHLRMLILTFSELAELPPYLAELDSLLYLDASHNDLTTVPQEFVALKQLQVLDLSDNRIGQREQERIRAMLPWCWVKF
jgi:hypothetical protein